MGCLPVRKYLSVPRNPAFCRGVTGAEMVEGLETRKRGSWFVNPVQEGPAAGDLHLLEEIQTGHSEPESL